MSSKIQKKRSNSESLADPKSLDQSPPKKQKKQAKKPAENEPALNGGAEGGEALTAKQRKRQLTKKRKLAAIAKVVEEGGKPKPLWPKKDKQPGTEGPKTIEGKIKVKQEKRAEVKKLRQEKRQQEGQYKVDQVKLSADEMRLRIAEIKGRETITKTARRKLGVLIKKLAIEEGTSTAKVGNGKAKNADDAEKGLTKSEKRRLRREKKEPGEEKEEDPDVEKPVDIQSFKLQKNKKQVQAAKAPAAAKPVEKKNGIKQGKGKKAAEKVVEEEEEEEDEDESEEEEAPEIEQESSDEEEEDNDEEDDDEDEEEDDEDDEDEKVAPVQKPVVKKVEQKGKKEQNQGAKKNPNQEQNSDKKKRYVLFVGNIPFDTKPEDLKAHFLTKVGEVSSVRIPTKPGTEVLRGFAYVEVLNDVDYEKGLSLHHTFLNGRRINVEYTLAGSKQVSKRKELVSKNQKLHAMRKAGQLAGSQKHDQKRSVRRSKQRDQERKPN